jgi:hypothetical protein
VSDCFVKVKKILAKEAQISQVQASMIDSGNLNTSIAIVVSIAKTVKVDLVEFFKD